MKTASMVDGEDDGVGDDDDDAMATVMSVVCCLHCYAEPDGSALFNLSNAEENPNDEREGNLDRREREVWSQLLP